MSDGVVSFRLPFAKETLWIELEIGDESWRIVALSEVLKDAISRLPDEGFVQNPEQRRNALNNKAMSVGHQLSAGAYRGNLMRMVNDILDKADKWLKEDYEHALNQHSREEFKEVINEIIERVEFIQDGRTEGC